MTDASEVPTTDIPAAEEIPTDTPEPKKKREAPPRIPAAVLETIYEVWIAHPDRVTVQPLVAHAEQAKRPGCWFSGRRGIGPTLEPLPAYLEDRLRLRDEGIEAHGDSEAQ